MRYLIVNKDEFQAELKQLGMKPGQFAEHLGIKGNTVSTWLVRGAIPYWVPHLLAAWRLLRSLGHRPPYPEMSSDQSAQATSEPREP